MEAFDTRLQKRLAGLGLLCGCLAMGLQCLIIARGDSNLWNTRLAVDPMLTVLSVTSVGTAYQMTCFTGIIRGGGDTKVTLINDLIHMWLIVIPSAALSAFVFHFSPVVVFGCLKCDQILKCGLAAIWVNSDRWIKKI